MQKVRSHAGARRRGGAFAASGAYAQSGSVAKAVGGYKLPRRRRQAKPANQELPLQADGKF